MNDSHSHEAHHGPGLKAYLVVAGALGIFTAISFIVNYFVTHHGLAPTAGFTIILGVAICKATLVGLYFMHLVLDWGRVYYFIIPAFILGAMMMVVLLPDVVLGWHQVSAAAPIVKSK